MKSSIFIFGMLIMCVMNTACRKDSENNIANESSLLNASKDFFEKFVASSEISEYNNAAYAKDSNYKATHEPGDWMNKRPQWEKAREVLLKHGQGILVPVYYGQPYFLSTNLDAKSHYSVDDITFLLIYKDASETFHAEKLTYYPDSNYLKSNLRHFSGIVTLKSWNGILINKFKFDETGTIRKYSDPKASLSSPRNTASGLSGAKAIDICYESYGYNYSADDPDYGYFWLQDVGCDTYFIDDEPAPADGSSGNSPGDYGGMVDGGYGQPGMTPTSSFQLMNGNNPISDIKSYFHCFSNIPGSNNNYSVTLCVAQPEPGSRAAWESTSQANGSLPLSVGHTFLIFNETTTLGSTIRNVGFYPRNTAAPYSPLDQGQLNNDASHYYDVALTIQLTSSEFSQVQSFVEQGNANNYMYDLNSNNCTTFAVNALAAAGYSLPRTVGSWPGGRGMNPGDLGEDIKSIPLSPNMSRTTVTGTHPNMGFCY